MKRNYAYTLGIALVLLTLILMSGCNIVAPDTTVAVEPAVNQQALEEEVKAAIFAYEEAYEAGDVDQLMTLYADDVVSVPPGYPMVQGKEAVEAGYREFFDAYTLDRDFNLLDLQVNGDTASRLMEWTNVWTPRGEGEMITEVGHCVFNYEKIDGEWKVTREIWNMEEVTIDQPTAASQVEEAANESLPKFYTSHGAHENLGMIDLASGAGTHIGRYQHPDLEIARTAWFALNGAVYENDFYTILNKRLPAESKPDEAEARLARVDMQTGELTLLGDPINLNLGGLEISPCGEVFAAGFSLTNAIGALYGDTHLYRVDPQDASLTLIGDTGLERIMDLAFDPAGTLWATVGNVLYTLDQETGTPTEMAAITGVEEDNEIMGIAFTSDGMLYGTSPWIDGFYTIDPVSGAATEVGRHGFEIVHGGDIPIVSDKANCE